MHQLKAVQNRGRFIKPCPGSPRHVCCGYKIINFAQGCNLGCTYCILNYYFRQTSPAIFKNQNDLFKELDVFLKDHKSLTRFGTGEFTDSLLFENEFPIYDKLIPRIASSQNAVLEIKTKTTNIERLLNIKEKENIIVSWSLNSRYIAEREERNAPGIDARIEAAYRVQEHGYRVSFHFDPIIHYDEWEKGYEETIDRLFEKIDPENTVYISMGTLRYIPEMREFMDKQGARYTGGEFIRGIDGKMRYFRPLRTRIYLQVLSFLSKYVHEDIVYLCMESPDVWRDVFGLDGMDTPKLIQRLDQTCFSKFRCLKNHK